MLSKVFVYGTLKYGNPNHCHLLNAKNGYSKFMCNAVTKKKYPLVVSSTANIPFLINKEGAGHVRYHLDIYYSFNSQKQPTEVF